MALLQRLRYASDHWALLVIFRGVHAAGKGSAIRHVMSGVNYLGCQVFSFKQPTDEDLEHDFLQRTTSSLPERGRIGISTTPTARTSWSPESIPRCCTDTDCLMS